MKNETQIKSLKKSVKETKSRLEYVRLLRMISILVVTCLLFITFIIRPVMISGDSMYPKLEDGQLGFTNILLRHVSPLKRFDLVTVFEKESDKYLVKRVIGLPNETIQFRDNILFVNGKAVKEDFFDQEYVDLETNNGRIHFTDDFGPVTLDKDEYFLMGDNRRHSTDSRALGAFHDTDIISRDVFIISR